MPPKGRGKSSAKRTASKAPQQAAPSDQQPSPQPLTLPEVPSTVSGDVLFALTGPTAPGYAITKVPPMTDLALDGAQRPPTAATVRSTRDNNDFGSRIAPPEVLAQCAAAVAVESASYWQQQVTEAAKPAFSGPSSVSPPAATPDDAPRGSVDAAPLRHEAADIAADTGLPEMIQMVEQQQQHRPATGSDNTDRNSDEPQRPTAAAPTMANLIQLDETADLNEGIVREMSLPSAEGRPTMPLRDAQIAALTDLGMLGSKPAAARPQVATTGGFADVRNPMAKVPDARDVKGSFYGLKHAAMRDRGYRHAVGGVTDVVVAADKPGGRDGAKLFSVLTSPAVAPFVASITEPEHRNLYALVDPVAPLDAYFDLDAHVFEVRKPDLGTAPDGSDSQMTTTVAIAPWIPDELLQLVAAETGMNIGRDASSSRKRRHEDNDGEPEDLNRSVVIEKGDPDATEGNVGTCRWSRQAIEEAILAIVLGECRNALESYFGSSTETCAVFTSSLNLPSDAAQAAAAAIVALNNSTGARVPLHRSTLDPTAIFSLKLSHHVHIRMADDKCFSRAEELRAFVRERLLAPQTAEGAREPWKQELLARVVDGSVYSQWRPFRLPFNCKLQSGRTPTLAEVAPSPADPLASVATRIGLRSLEPLLVGEGVTAFRPLLAAFTKPAAAGADGAEGQAVSLLPEPADDEASRAAGVLPLRFDFIQGSGHAAANIAAEAFSVKALEMSLIGRFAGSRLQFVVDATPHDEVLADDTPVEVIDPVTGARVLVHPRGRGAAKPPINNGAEPQNVTPEQHVALQELFMALHPQYRASMQTSSIKATYKDNGQFRMYYVYQKTSKFCLRLGREHKETYGQLYVTYQSIKYRCYSNDCHERCHVVPFKSAAELEEGDANGLRLLECRKVLFPELAEGELRRRYPWDFYNTSTEDLAPAGGASGSGPVADAAPAS